MVERFQKDCMYCAHTEKLAQNYIEIESLHVATVYLARDQTHRGRIAVVLNWHVDEPFQLTDVERHEFYDDVAHAAAAVDKAVHPGKINYGTYGDTVSHLHVHVVPKQPEDGDWNDAFVNNPSSPKHLSDAEYDAIIEDIKVNL
ncbi:HIT family protein [Furfurilactobacillus entadae]|uniref:HIT family protein n=1 Tax=Furfurilactobacillus entadae TaxID=2922307 RepID=UPI0035E74250